MLGALPTTLEVNGRVYDIRTDFRDILRIIAAYQSPKLTDQDKLYVCMKQIYVEVEAIPRADFTEAFNKALTFIECEHQHDVKKRPRLVNWVKDEQLIFPAINKVAGFETRTAEYVHWWTFMGYFHGIDKDDTWSFILSIRQKRAKHKPLEKYEKEFYLANKALCDVDEYKSSKEQSSDALLDIFNDLV